ncbi:MAG: hypothetical protein K6F58_07170 [Bacteroidales bacterium]|nr:hypothetical protein [Bacteroidales bacterium]
MKRNIAIILLAAALLSLTGCVNKFKQVKITSVELESVKPRGMKTYDAVVQLGIENPAPSFNIMNLKADVRRDSLAIIHLSGENVAVAGRSSKVYRVPVTAQIDSSVTLLQLALLARSFNAELYVVDLSAKAMVAGVGKTLEYTGIPLASLLNKASQ